MKLWALSKPFQAAFSTITEYRIMTGSNIGRWTVHFGPHCLTDFKSDAIGALNAHNENFDPDCALEEYTLSRSIPTLEQTGQ